MEHEMSKKRQVFNTLVERKGGITAEAVAELIKAPVSTVKTYLEEFKTASLHVERGTTSEGVAFYKFDAMGIDSDTIYDSIKMTQVEKKQQLKDKLLGGAKKPAQEPEPTHKVGSEDKHPVPPEKYTFIPTVQQQPMQQTMEVTIKLKIKIEFEAINTGKE